MARTRPSIRLIAGPTASGKSALALEMADKTGAVIVNADSMQLYRDLRILTARPNDEEEARAEHRLFGIADGAEAWSTGRWLRAVAEILDELRASDRPAIVVGGTGLYFHALTRGIADIPEVPAAVRTAVAEEFDREGEQTFRRALHDLDPRAEARIAPGDRQRLVRAMSVARASGRALTDWQADTRPILEADAFDPLVLEPPRDELYRRCDERLDAMVEAGVLAEVEALAARGLDPDLPVMKATGVREFMGVVRGERSLEDAIDAAKRETRRYAKRQYTWLRNQAADWPRRGQAG